MASDEKDIATRAVAMRAREIELRKMIMPNSSIGEVFGVKWFGEARGMAVYVFQM